MRDVPLKVKVDLLFLDIELPNYNGIYVGEYIRNDINNYAMHIIYVSSKLIMQWNCLKFIHMIL